MRTRIDQNEEGIEHLKEENQDQKETIESLTAQVRELQNWRRRHDFVEHVCWALLLFGIVAFSISLWVLHQDIVG